MSRNNIDTYPISASASGDYPVVAGVTNMVHQLIGYSMTPDASVSLKWRSGTTDKTGAMPCAAGIEKVFLVPFNRSIVRTAPGEALNLNLSGIANVGGFAIVRTTDALPSSS